LVWLGLVFVWSGRSFESKFVRGPIPYADLQVLSVAPGKRTDDVLNAAGQQLKGYFDRICLSMSPRKFLNSSFKLRPHAGEVGDKDLLVYITQASLIVSLFDQVYEPDVTHQYPSMT
jgi:hypothetical protein